MRGYMGLYWLYGAIWGYILTIYWLYSYMGLYGLHGAIWGYTGYMGYMGLYGAQRGYTGLYYICVWQKGRREED